MSSPRTLQPGTLRHRLHEIIFEADTPAGKLFDVLLLWSIFLSVLAVSLESVSSIRESYGPWLTVIEWIFTGLFTIEYIVRVFAVAHPWRYILSFYGIVDLLAVIPTYLSLVVTNTHYLIVIRILRLLRIFRVLKLARYLGEAHTLRTAILASRPKIVVFLTAVFSLVIIMGALMHLIEGPQYGFSSIPKGMYWAIVTMTTVGYGDISPQTPLGQCLAAALMVCGYGIIAVPTGIVSVELSRAQGHQISTRACEDCGRGGHEIDAKYCKFCSGVVVA